MWFRGLCSRCVANAIIPARRGHRSLAHYISHAKYCFSKSLSISVPCGVGSYSSMCSLGIGVNAELDWIASRIQHLELELQALRHEQRRLSEKHELKGSSLGVIGCRKLTTPSELVDNVDIFIFDCDGVIWRGDSLIEGVPAVLDKLREAGKRFFFVTNNSTKSRAGYKAKFDSLGLTSVKPEEIFSSSFAAAAYLEQTNFKDTGKKVYIIGEKGISEELDLLGIPWCGAELDKSQAPNMGKGGKLEIDRDVGAVIVGFDRHISYYKLQYAQLCLNGLLGCQFIATNMDRVTHLTDAQEWAGNRSMVEAVRGCTGLDPKVVGKPEPLMIEYIANKYGISDLSRICMVGDRLDTDIAFGLNNNLKTCLTLSGVTSEDELLDKVPRKPGTEGIQPDFYVTTINDFFM